MAKRKPKPWEQQPGEPVRAFRSFLMYRDMMNRSLAGLTRMLGRKSNRNMEKLSATYDWGERVLAWDNELNRRVMQDQSIDMVKMKKRHVGLSMGMQDAGTKELLALVHQVNKASRAAKAKAREEGLDPDKVHHDPTLKLNELLRLIDAGVNLERLTKGEPTEHTRIEEARKVDLSQLSTKELKELKAWQKKLGIVE